MYRIQPAITFRTRWNVFFTTAIIDSVQGTVTIVVHPSKQHEDIVYETMGLHTFRQILMEGTMRQVSGQQKLTSADIVQKWEPLALQDEPNNPLW